MRGRAHPYDRLTDDVMQRQLGRAQGIAGQDRAESKRLAAVRRLEARRQELGGAQAGDRCHRVSAGDVQRLHRVSERVHGTRAQQLRRRRGHQPGTASTSAGRTRGRSSNPARVRWPDDISAPERVVGTAHTLPPRADAIALATSITRPPPHATSLRFPTTAASPAATSGTAPRGHVPDRARTITQVGGTSACARSVVSSSSVVPKMIERGLPEPDHALAVAPFEVGHERHHHRTRRRSGKLSPP